MISRTEAVKYLLHECQQHKFLTFFDENKIQKWLEIPLKHEFNVKHKIALKQNNQKRFGKE